LSDSDMEGTWQEIDFERDVVLWDAGRMK